ncbi:MAG TPA: hypothetical protein VMU84_01875, partial [Thermoanaerobaculia bacterium]|nr:hypothetical protein [Thermoanaerobaculia bacterium]
MPKFSWKGRGPNGQIVSGETDAASKEAVVEKLRDLRIMVMEVVEKSGDAYDSDRLLPQEPVMAPTQDKRAQDNRPRPFRGLLV